MSKAIVWFCRQSNLTLKKNPNHNLPPPPQQNQPLPPKKPTNPNQISFGGAVVCACNKAPVLVCTF